MSALKRNFLGVDQIERGLLEVAAADPTVLIVGGLAMQLYGSDRLTADIDVAAGGRPSPDLQGSWPHLRPLTFGGVETRTPSGIPVDWIVREDDFEQVYMEAIGAGRRVEGVPLPVVSPEYLAVMKMIAGREKDESDLIFLLQTDHADQKKTLRIVHRLLGSYAAQAFDRYCEEADWKKSRGSR